MTRAGFAGGICRIVAWELAGQPEVHRRAQGVHVGTGVAPATGEDLGGRVIPASGERSSGGDPHLAVQPGRAEVRQSVPAIGVEEDILRLDVAVKDAVTVSGAERWLISFARARTEKTMSERLAAELILASKGEGNTIKKKEDTHRMAEANRAFAHYPW